MCGRCQLAMLRNSVGPDAGQAMKQRRPPEKRGGRYNDEGKATGRSAEDVFHLIEKAGGALGGLIFHSY